MRGCSVENPPAVAFQPGGDANGLLQNADFREWMEAHALTLDSAARALGLSRRMIAYYLSGEKPIPKTVMLATEGWSQRVGA